jgi:GAF domain-containing protein
LAYERAFSEIKRLSSAELEGPELLRRSAEALRQVVPFGSYCVAALDPASNLITHIFNGGSAGEGGHAEAYGDVLHQTYFEEALGRLASMLRERRPAQPLSEAICSVLDRSLRYREYLGPVGFGHELAGLFVDGGPWGAGYLTRRRGEPDFGRGEVSLLGRVAPYVGAGVKAAELRSRVTDGRRGPGVPGMHTLDRTESVLSYTPAAERCSRRWRIFARGGTGTASRSPSGWPPEHSSEDSTPPPTEIGTSSQGCVCGDARGAG